MRYQEAQGTGEVSAATNNVAVLNKISKPKKGMPFPAASASPKEVRVYVAHLLTTKHDVEHDLAAELANRWQLGRGIDFREANRQQFNKVFGEEVGPYLYRTVRSDESEEWKHSTMGIAHYCKIIPLFQILPSL